MSKKRQLELVNWVDSHSSGGTWIEAHRLAEEMPIQRITTLGWVEFEDDDWLIVSASHDEKWESVGEVLSIAKVAITNRTQVKVDEMGIHLEAVG